MPQETISVQDIMTKDVVSVPPEMPLQDAARVLAEHNFDGVPVVDGENKLVGILTEYDLISKSTLIHFPTLQKIIQNLGVYSKDKSQFKENFAEVAALKVKDAMNSDPLMLSEDATYEEVLGAFRDHHRVNPIPVINKDRKVIGVVSRFDVLKPLRLVGAPIDYGAGKNGAGLV